MFMFFIPHLHNSHNRYLTFWLSCADSEMKVCSCLICLKMSENRMAQNHPKPCLVYPHFPIKIVFFGHLDLGVFPIFDPSISRHLQVTTLQDRHAHVHCLSKRAWPSQLGYSSTSGFPPCSKHGDFNMFLTAKNEDSTWCVFQTGYWWDTLWLWIIGLLRCIDGP